MSFTLPTFTTVLVKSVNIRAEVHGKEKVPAADIGFRLTCSNQALAMFDGGLLFGLYKPAADGDEDEPELDGVEPVADRPMLRCPSIAMPIDLSREYVGRDIVIDYGMGGSSNLNLNTCTIGAFKVDAKEGGTVEIDFRAQVSHLDPETLGALGCLVKHDVLMTLMSSPQSDNTQEQLPGAAPKVHSAQGALIVDPAADDKPADATGAFLDAHGEKSVSEAASGAPAPTPSRMARAIRAAETKQRGKTKGRGNK